MEVQLKRKLKRTEFAIQKYFFLDDIKDSLKRYATANKLDYLPELRYTNFKHHAEIYDILIIENGEKKSMLKLFERFSLIITSDDMKLKIYLSSKDPLQSGNMEFGGQLGEFKKFLADNITFCQGRLKEIVFYD